PRVSVAIGEVRENRGRFALVADGPEETYSRTSRLSAELGRLSAGQGDVEKRDALSIIKPTPPVRPYRLVKDNLRTDHCIRLSEPPHSKRHEPPALRLDSGDEGARLPD